MCTARLWWRWGGIITSALPRLPYLCLLAPFLTYTPTQISHSLTTFGISATSTDMLVVKIATAAEVSAESVAAHLDGAVEGTMGVFGEEDVGRGADVGRIRGVYRLGGGGGGGKGSGKRRRKDGGVEGSGGGGGGGEGNGDGERERRELEVNVLGLMALRGAL